MCKAEAFNQHDLLNVRQECRYYTRPSMASQSPDATAKQIELQKATLYALRVENSSTLEALETAREQSNAVRESYFEAMGMEREESLKYEWEALIKQVELLDKQDDVQCEEMDKVEDWLIAHNVDPWEGFEVDECGRVRV
jgi:hypothetical protein